MESSKTKLNKRTMVASVMILIVIPLTIFWGIWRLDDRKYYFISLLIIIYTMVPFFMVFERREPKARELMVLAVMTAIAVAGRAAFYMIPQFKPVVAIVIITAVCFGPESGFMVGAMTGFVSNFFFGQGPWTPWQMFGFGIIGFVSGILFKKNILPKKKIPLCVFGFFATILIYGGLLNPASVLMFQGKLTWETLLASYIMGIWFDLIHGLATSFFLFFLADPFIEKLDRVKIKYGMIEP